MQGRFGDSLFRRSVEIAYGQRRSRDMHCSREANGVPGSQVANDQACLKKPIGGEPAW